MSYAVIKTGGKQYKVKSGEILKIEKLPDSKPETKIEFNEILAYGDNKSIEIGTPNVEGAKVEADLIKNSKNRTILIFKKRRRQNSRRKNGHRQQYSLIRIKKASSVMFKSYSTSLSTSIKVCSIEFLCSINQRGYTNWSGLGSAKFVSPHSLHSSTSCWNSASQEVHFF